MKKEKKMYVAPSCEVVELETSVSILAGSIDITPGEEDNIVTGGNRHRGEWGNLWESRD